MPNQIVSTLSVLSLLWLGIFVGTHTRKINFLPVVVSNSNFFANSSARGTLLISADSNQHSNIATAVSQTIQTHADSNQKARSQRASKFSLDVTMAGLFPNAPPGVTYPEWSASSKNILNHAEFLKHPFSSPGSTPPFPHLDRVVRQVCKFHKFPRKTFGPHRTNLEFVLCLKH